jgi:hypothetical protein
MNLSWPRRPYFTLAMLFGIACCRFADAADTAALQQQLAQAGVAQSRILGTDERGIPQVCGTVQPSGGQATAEALAATARSWEAVPGVIRTDGVDGFRILVEVGSPVAAVTMPELSDSFNAPSAAPVVLRDDGTNGDAVAGDNIYTSGVFTFKAGAYFYDHWNADPDSPAGINIRTVGRIAVEETSGATSDFLIWPTVGLVAPDVPLTSTVNLTSDIVISPHLINVRTSGRNTQSTMRNLPADTSNVTNPIYAAVPDAFDMLMLFSVDHVEQSNMLAAANFNAGVHYPVKVDYSGTGLNTFDNSAAFGSSRLLGMNLMDSLSRGVYGANAVHEIMHHWSAYVDFGLGVKDDGSHWSSRSNAASIVGGQRWIDNGDGTYTMDCSEGHGYGAHHAAPIDKYMMGLIDEAAVPNLLVYDPAGTPPLFRCDQTFSDVVTTVSIADIQALHGVRAPGTATARRDFAMAFVAESHDRLLTPVEMTFYEILAAHFTRDVPAGDPDPYIDANWPSITRFFGEGTTWHSNIPVQDQDLDAVFDFDDNCRSTANPDQRDTDGDGFGNRCDADLDNSLMVDAADLALMLAAAGSADADADLNGDGVVGSLDLGILMSRYNQPPG